MSTTRIVLGLVAAAGVTLAPPRVTPQGGALGIPGALADESAPACDAWDVEYQLSANLLVSDTMMGAGDGMQPIGPGKLVLRLDNGGAGAAKLLSYELHQAASFTSTALFWKTKVQTDMTMSAAGDACVGAAEGTLAGRTLRWTTPVKGYKGDGTITCEGAFCGTFGAPASGRSPMHVPPIPSTSSRSISAPTARPSRWPTPWCRRWTRRDRQLESRSRGARSGGRARPSGRASELGRLLTADCTRGPRRPGR